MNNKKISFDDIEFSHIKNKLNEIAIDYIRDKFDCVIFLSHCDLNKMVFAEVLKKIVPVSVLSLKYRFFWALRIRATWKVFFESRKKLLICIPDRLDNEKEHRVIKAVKRERNCLVVTDDTFVIGIVQWNKENKVLKEANTAVQH